jgi:hypothetical protein
MLCLAPMLCNKRKGLTAVADMLVAVSCTSKDKLLVYVAIKIKNKKGLPCGYLSDCIGYTRVSQEDPPSALVPESAYSIRVG